jgi:hypothetical protein
MKIGILILVLLTIFYFYPTDDGKGKVNIDNCLSLNLGMSKPNVLKVMGEPSNTFNDGKQLQYFPTTEYSSCQIILEFELNSRNQLLLTEKFCDDGQIDRCLG